MHSVTYFKRITFEIDCLILTLVFPWFQVPTVSVADEISLWLVTLVGFVDISCFSYYFSLSLNRSSWAAVTRETNRSQNRHLILVATVTLIWGKNYSDQLFRNGHLVLWKWVPSVVFLVYSWYFLSVSFWYIHDFRELTIMGRGWEKYRDLSVANGSIRLMQIILITQQRSQEGEKRGFVYAWPEYYLQPTVGQHCA